MSDQNPNYGPQPVPHGGYGPPPPGGPAYGPQPPHGGVQYPGYYGPPQLPPVHYIPPEHQPPAGSTVTALVLSVLLVPMCLGNLTPVIGTVMAGMALSERGRNPERHDRLRRYAWISNWIHLGLFAFVLTFFVLVLTSAP